MQRPQAERSAFPPDSIGAELGRAGRGGPGPVSLFIACTDSALRPDLVHHVTHKPVLYGSIIARLLRVPAVVNAVSGLGYAFVAEGVAAVVRRRLMLALYRVAFRHPNSAVIFQNRDDIALFESVSAVRPGQVVLIPGSGVDLEQFRPTPEPEGPPVITFAARMLWDKGVGDFVEAARILKQRRVIARAVLIGEPDPGNPRSVTSGQLIEWAHEGAVEWLGHRADMPQVFADSHIVCLPSCYREGVPKVLLEAAAAGPADRDHRCARLPGRRPGRRQRVDRASPTAGGARSRARDARAGPGNAGTVRRARACPRRGGVWIGPGCRHNAQTLRAVADVGLGWPEPIGREVRRGSMSRIAITNPGEGGMAR